MICVIKLLQTKRVKCANEQRSKEIRIMSCMYLFRLYNRESAEER